MASESSESLSKPEDVSLKVEHRHHKADMSENQDDQEMEDDDNESEDEMGPSFLHDCVSIGNFERGLIGGTEEGGVPNNTIDDFQQQRAEVERLPLLLRILSKSRPLASISLPLANRKGVKRKEAQKHDEDNDGDTTDTENPGQHEQEDELDEVLEEAVRRLEDRAAVYSVSEGVEVVACHLAPHVGRKISKLSPCRRKPDGSWEVAELAAVAQNPASSRFRQQQHQEGGGAAPSSKRRKVICSLGGESKKSASTSKAGLQTSDGGESDEYGMGDGTLDEEDGQAANCLLKSKYSPAPGSGRVTPKRKRIASSSTLGGEAVRESSLLLSAGASEDSQEAFVTKTLSELALLVTAYLQQQQQRANTEGSNKEEATDMTAAASVVNFSFEESILAQARVDSETSVGGIIGTDLGATVASLFHHATVLRHNHTAAALCLSGQPQTSHLIQRLAVNCPAGIPSLTRGCIDSASSRTCAFVSSSFGEGNNNGSNNGNAQKNQQRLARDSILALSQLSGRERQRIRTTLRCMGEDAMNYAPTLLEIQLQMALDHGDPVDLACFLLQHAPSVPFQQVYSTSYDKEAVETSSGPQSGGETEEAGGENEDGVHNHDAAKSAAGAADNNEHHHDDEDDEVEERRKRTSLARLISQKQKVWLHRIFQCLVDGMDFANEHHTSGRLCLLLRAYLWICLTQNVKALAAAKSSLSKFTYEAARLLTPMQEQQQRSVGLDESPLNCLYSLLLLCSLLSVIGLAQPSDMQVENNKELEEHTIFINDLFVAAPTVRSKVLAGCVSCCLRSSSDDPVLRLWLARFLGLSTADDVQTCKCLFLRTEAHIRKWCNGTLPNLSVALDAALDAKSVICDPSALVLTLNQSPSILSRDQVETILKDLLLGKSNQSVGLLSSGEVIQLITNAVSYLNDLEGLKFPIVQPLQVDRQACVFVKAFTGSVNVDTACFLLQLVYCFAFRGANPDSPFAFNPRSMPLKQVWLICDSPKYDVSVLIREYLLEQIERNAYDVADLAQYHKRIQSSHHLLASANESVKKEDVKRSLRTCILSKDVDPSGEVAEQLFLRAFLSFPEEELISSTASAFISHPKSPPVYISLAKLYGDPLVLMKCSISGFWERPGVRRVALFLLSTLLNGNAVVLAEACDNESTPQEFLAARDMLTLRCLVLSAIKAGISGVDCFSTVGMVRWLVSSHRGLVAILLKQGMPLEEVDWLCNFVPELMSDAIDFGTLFTDSVSLSAAQRLAVADGVVQAVILYGQRNEPQSEALVINSMAHLIAAFFLLVGVSGVSVSTLISENDSTTNATQLSRIGALRILKHVSDVRGYRKRIRSECVISLQKLYRMCKGEELVGGISVSIGARQKGAMKEIFDAVGRALSSMGAGA